MSDWITDNRGEGPWDFEAQKDKLGYVNNPRWVATPASDVEHEPCGYWLKTLPPAGPIPMNLYIGSRDAGFWVVYFNGENISYVDKYYRVNSNVWVATRDSNNVLINTGNDPVTTLRLETVTLIPPFTVTSTINPFLANDFEDSQVEHRCNVINGKLYFNTAHVKGQLVRLNSGYQREARGYFSTVVTGTDGNLYVNTDQFVVHPDWDAAWRPITGAFWNFRWTLLADMVCDSPISTWGIGPIHQGRTGVQSTNYNGDLYFSYGSPLGLRRVDPTTLAILGANATADARGTAVGRAGKIYIFTSTQISGTECKYVVTSYDATSCGTLVVGPDLISPIGQQGPSGCALGPSYLITWSLHTATGGPAPATNSWTIQKIDYDTLEVIQSVILVVPDNPIPNIMKIHGYDSRYWIAAYTYGVGIINASSMTWKSNLDLGPKGFQYTMNLDTAFRHDAYTAPDPVTSPFNPVWTMPPTTWEE
jgi:hypothetical protein